MSSSAGVLENSLCPPTAICSHAAHPAPKLATSGAAWTACGGQIAMPGPFRYGVRLATGRSASANDGVRGAVRGRDRPVLRADAYCRLFVATCVMVTQPESAAKRAVAAAAARVRLTPDRIAC